MRIQTNSVSPKIGEIYYMQFSGSGSEQCGWRPGLVFQNNTGNEYSPNIIAVPLTSCIKKSSQPTHVVISSKDSGLRLDSMALCENPERLSKDKIGKYVTTLSNDYMKKIAEASILATSAISFLDLNRLIEIYEKAVALNR